MFGMVGGVIVAATGWLQVAQLGALLTVHTDLELTWYHTR